MVHPSPKSYVVSTQLDIRGQFQFWVATFIRPTPEPTVIPKLPVKFADFPYSRSWMRLEASHLGDLMRIWVRLVVVGSCRRQQKKQAHSRELP